MTRTRTKPADVPLFEGRSAEHRDALDRAEIADGLLNLWEYQTQMLLELDAGVALQARFARLFSGRSGEHADSADQRSALLPESDRLALAGALGTLRAIERRYRLTDDERGNIIVSRRVLLALIEGKAAA